jgi:hypothetical protein
VRNSQRDKKANSHVSRAAKKKLQKAPKEKHQNSTGMKNMRWQPAKTGGGPAVLSLFFFLLYR